MKKFTQINEKINEYGFVCLIVNDDKYLEESNIFKTELDMNNWLLNMVNEELSKYRYNIIEPHDYEHWQDRMIIINNRYIITDSNHAISWLQTYKNILIYCAKSEVINNVKDKYDTNIISKSKKYNII